MAIVEKLLTGSAVEPCLDALASLRLDIFREFPYLYDGRSEDELRYLRRYAEEPGACVILVQDSGSTVGAVTGMPLAHEDIHLLQAFAAAPYPVEAIYYVGELLFYPAYRNRGLGLHLMALVEEHVRSRGDFRYLTCATVVRPDNHPLRPIGYLPIDRFLARAGFRPLPGIATGIAWCETDGVRSDHPMQFWVKALCGRR